MAVEVVAVEVVAVVAAAAAAAVAAVAASAVVAASTVCLLFFAGVPRARVGVQGREAHQAHPPRRRRPLRNPVGDSNGGGGANLDWDSSSDGSGEVVVLGEEDRIEALPRGARSENSALPLL